MFRFLQYSDSHLGFEQYGSVTRLADFASSLDEVLRVAISMKVDAVVDTGDTFDSPHPDPFSIRALRVFVESLAAAGIKFVGIVGNHNRHEIQTKISGADWFTAVSDRVIRPSAPETPIWLTNSSGEGIKIVCADWMPSADITDFLVRVPAGVDALFMHQSCEHFLPSISRPEMVISQVDGLARYVGIGDVHVTKTVVTPKGTIVGSAGSTEMSKRNEDPGKYVFLVTFGDNPAPDVERVEIHTRGIVTFPTITMADQIPALIDTVRRRMAQGGRAPMVVVSHDRSVSVEIQAARKIIEDMGVDIVRFTSESAVVEEDVLATHVQSGSTLMTDVIKELFSEDSMERELALSLWEAPGRTKEIIDSFVAQLKKKEKDEQDDIVLEAIVAPMPPT